MRNFIELLERLFHATSTMDKILLVIYTIVLIPMGIILSSFPELVPQSIVAWFGSFTGENDFTLYTVVFLALQIVNITTMISFVFLEHGFIQTIRAIRHNYYFMDEDTSWYGPVFNLAFTVFVALVNIFMFPVFIVLYLLVGIIALFAFSN